jgi:hypothetical protein
MSGQSQTMNYNLKQTGGKVLLAAPAAASESVVLNKVTVPAFGVVIVGVK